MAANNANTPIPPKKTRRAGSTATTAPDAFEDPAENPAPTELDQMLGAPARSAEAFWPSAKRLLGLMSPYRAQFAIVVVLVTASVVLSVVAPSILGRAMDVLFSGIVGKQLPAEISLDQAIEAARAQGQGALADVLATSGAVPGQGVDFHRLGQLILCVLGMYMAAAFLMWLQGWLLNRIVMRVIQQLRARVEEKINRLPLSYFDAHQRGDVLSRVTNDVDNIQMALQQALSQLVQSVLTVLGVGVMMFVVSWQLALIAMAALVVSGVVAGIIGTRTQKLFRAQWKYTGAVNGHIEESLTGHELVLLYNRGDAMAAEFEQRNQALTSASFRAQALSGAIMPAMQWLQYLSYVLVAVGGALRVTSGQMTVGGVTSFIQYSREFAQPITEIASVTNQLQSGVASAERTFELLDAEEQVPEVATAQLPARTSGAVQFEHVCFSYDPAQPLIEDLSLSVKPGQTVAIVGPTGAGKTTLVNLLMRFYELNSGRIVLDGVDIATLARADLRRRIGMVLQDTWLYEGTIRDNIRYGRLDATDEEVVAAAQATMVDRFVRLLPDGYDTVLSENGTSLSAGERQLLTIARAFLAQPSLLILDEATSSVDTRTEMLVQYALQALRSDRTSFVIAHRLSTIRDADLILMMEGGRIVEQGTHNRLLALNGAYATMYRAQFAGASDQTER